MINKAIFVDGGTGTTLTLDVSTGSTLYNYYVITDSVYSRGKISTDTLQVRNGGTTGYILTSDSNGNGSWQAPAGGGTNVSYWRMGNLDSTPLTGECNASIGLYDTWQHCVLFQINNIDIYGNNLSVLFSGLTSKSGVVRLTKVGDITNFCWYKVNGFTTYTNFLKLQTGDFILTGGTPSTGSTYEISFDFIGSNTNGTSGVSGTSGSSGVSGTSGSSGINGVDSTGYVLQGASYGNPLANKSYYYGNNQIQGVSETRDNNRVYIPKSGNIKHISMYYYSSASASTESVSGYTLINNNLTGATLIGTFSASNLKNYISVDTTVSVTKGDYLEFLIKTPNWTQLPGFIYFNNVVYIE